MKGFIIFRNSNYKITQFFRVLKMNFDYDVTGIFY